MQFRFAADGERSTPVLLAFAIAIFALVIAVQNTSLRGWWLYDDPQLVIEGILQPVSGTLFDRTEYTHLAAHTFTPLLVLSFKADVAMAGLEPRYFYLHQLLALALGASLLFALLARFVPPVHAFAGTLAFVFSWQMAYSARTLMIRHYVEGLVFTLAALLVWSTRSKPLLRDIIASTLYLLALLSKELYAPLPLFFLAISLACDERIREALVRMVLPAFALAVFLFWRWKMTGLLGTYNEPLTLQDLASLPGKIWMQHLGPAPLAAQVVLSLLVLAALAAWLVRSRRSAALIVAAIVFVFVPVYSLAHNFEWRFSFAATVVTVGVVTLGASKGLRHHAATAVLVAIALTSALITPGLQRSYETTTRAAGNEGRYIWAGTRDGSVLAATSPEWYLSGLAWLRNFGGTGKAPDFITSKWPIVNGSVPRANVVVVDDRLRATQLLRLSPADPRAKLFGTPEEWTRLARQRDVTLPLDVQFAYDRGDVSWNLGPMPGEFIFITDPAGSATPVPASGKRRVGLPREQNWFRIVRTTPDGTWRASSRLAIPADGERTVWSGR